MATTATKKPAAPKTKRARRPVKPASEAAIDKRDWTRIRKLPITERYLAAIEKCDGRLTQVAKGLQLDVNSVRATINRSVELHNAMVNAREVIVDKAEQALMDQVERGNVQATQFLLKTQGKSRGFSEKETRAKLEQEVLRELLERIEKVVTSEIYESILVALTGSGAEAQGASGQTPGGNPAAGAAKPN